MKVLVTGAAGQLGRELRLAAPDDVEVAACDRQQLDITQVAEVERTFAALQPDIVVNAAAYTAVDGAESERDLAFAVNAEGARNVARSALAAEARLIHVSTDFIFDGERSHPYPVDASPAPRSVYGASKLAGERHVLEISAGRALVIRTAWVYSRFGSNFVKTMLRLLAERGEISVVADQVGTPTWARSLAAVIWAATGHDDLEGLLHWTDAGVASWYDFAIAVQEEAVALGLFDSSCTVTPVDTSAYPTAATRPAYSVLDTSATWQALGLEPVHWRRQLRAMLQEMREDGEN